MSIDSVMLSNHLILCAVLCLVAQSCPTLWDPMGCSPPGSSVRGDSPSKNTAVGCHALLQRIFPTQGLNPGLLHCRQILYHLSYTEVSQHIALNLKKKKNNFNNNKNYDFFKVDKYTLDFKKRDFYCQP